MELFRETVKEAVYSSDNARLNGDGPSRFKETVYIIEIVDGAIIARNVEDTYFKILRSFSIFKNDVRTVSFELSFGENEQGEIVGTRFDLVQKNKDFTLIRIELDEEHTEKEIKRETIRLTGNKANRIVKLKAN